MLTREQKLNVKNLDSIMRSGEKNVGDFKVGLEIEHFLIDRASGEVKNFSEENGILALLEVHRDRAKDLTLVNDQIIGLEFETYGISIEPGSQFEISLEQQSHIKDLDKAYSQFIKTFEGVVRAWGLDFVNAGYLPKGLALERELLPYRRYDIMNDYFHQFGTSGAMMMRGTGSTHITIDYYNEADCILKMRLLNLIAPIVTYMTSNTKVVENEYNTNPLIRYNIWNGVDPHRPLIPDDLFHEGFGYHDYINYVMSTPQMIYIEDGVYKRTELNGYELYKNSIMSEAEQSLMLSVVFPNVRLRNYLELRAADSMSIQSALGYAALIKGLFMNPKPLERLLKLNEREKNDILNAYESIILKGSEGEAYNLPLEALIESLLSLARINLNEGEWCYLEVFEGCRV